MLNNYMTLDVNILYSLLNTKLRDHYSSLDDLCEYEDIELEKLLKRLEKENLIYCKETNKIIFK